MKTHVFKSLILVSLVAGSATAWGALPTVNELLTEAEGQIEAGKFHGDMASFDKAVLTLDKAQTLEPKNPWVWYYKGLEATAASTMHQIKSDAPGAAKLLDEADHDLQKSLELLKTGEALALHSGVLATLIQFRGADSGAELGPRAGEEMNEARELAPQSPQVLLHAGLAAFFTPPEWGGDIKESAKLFQQSIDAYSKGKRAAPLPNWGAADAHIWLGQAEQKLGDPAKARAEFEKALEIEPNYAWVKMVLLPGLKSAAKPKSE